MILLRIHCDDICGIVGLSGEISSYFYFTMVGWSVGRSVSQPIQSAGDLRTALCTLHIVGDKSGHRENCSGTMHTAHYDKGPPKFPTELTRLLSVHKIQKRATKGPEARKGHQQSPSGASKGSCRGPKDQTIAKVLYGRFSGNRTCLGGKQIYYHGYNVNCILMILLSTRAKK